MKDQQQALSRILSVLLLCLTGDAFAQVPVTAEAAEMSATVSPEGGRILVEARGVRAKAPLFFSANVEQVVRLSTKEMTGTMTLKVRVAQGAAETVSLGIAGEGEVVGVAGDGLRDWAVRRVEGRRFLDLRLSDVSDKSDLTFTVETRLADSKIPGKLAVLTLTPGDAVGFSARVVLEPAAGVEARAVEARGFVPLGEDKERVFFTTGDAALEVMLARSGAAVGDAELAGVQLTGIVNADAGSVDFRLRGEARVREAEAKIRLLSGRAALTEVPAGDGWRVDLVRAGEEYAYELVFERAGIFPIDLAFAAAIREEGGWRRLDFKVPGGAVVPVTISGLTHVTFEKEASVVPRETEGVWRGFLPADGGAKLVWKPAREAGEGALFFTTHETTEVRVGSGLLRQSAEIAFRILQGKLGAVRIGLEGPGEILGVEGDQVLGWKIVPEGGKRVLEVQLSRPFENEGTVTVRSQAALGAFPVRAEPLRLTPEGTTRHAGYVRIANTGAVRLEIAEAQGMMQLAPEQFPGAAAEEGSRQVFVYRFPSATYDYRVVADQILPEVGVSQIVVYELTETDRVITADIELDIREAPLREWSMAIPADYAVVGVGGAAVADYVAASEAEGESRVLKFLFKDAVQGRQLLRVRLEKNEAAAAGEWALPALAYPGAKSVRGDIGVVAAPGFRTVPKKVEGMTEAPLTYFPKQLAGLAQAWRLKDERWSALLTIEALGQSISADVFHLYSLAQGVAHGSVLINYFVVGAPASEWRIAVPESLGNIDIVGQNVRRDWRREGDEVIVTLHQPVLGAATLLVTFEQPMSARGGTIQPGEVRPLGVQSERGYLQVVSPLQLRHEVVAAKNLLKLEPLELPTEYRILSSAPSLAAYQYTARPFEMAVKIEWFAPAEMVDQLVDFAKLSSQVSRDGQVATDARFFVKTRGRKALRMELPAGAELWEARVDGGVVTARVDGAETLVPLPARLDPNEPVEVSLRLGQAAKDDGKLTLTTPKLLVPTVISEWTLHSDAKRQLVPRGGSANLTQPVLTETGFEWISVKRAAVMLLLALVAGGAFLARRRGWKQALGLLAALAASLMALLLADEALNADERRVNHGHLEYASAVIPAGEVATVEVANVPAWRAMISWLGVIAGVVGAGLLALALLTKRTSMAVAGAVLLSAGLLWQRGGGAMFFALIAAGAFLFILLPGIRGMWRRRVVQAAALLLLAVTAQAEDEPWLAEGAHAAESMVQTWKIREGRLYGEIELRVQGKVGEAILLLGPPAVLTGFESDGLRVSKGESGYFVVPEREGELAARATFELPVADLTKGIVAPTGPAAVQRIRVELDQQGWEFTSPMAAKIEVPETNSGTSVATLFIGPGARPVISLRPKQRDVSAEATQFFAEVANLYLPGPGVVNGRHRVTIRPAQGRVSRVELAVPEGFTVGEVSGEGVGAWRFDPEKRQLSVTMEPAQTATFSMTIETQRGAEELPIEMTLAPLRVVGAAGEVGTLALGFGGDAQAENVRAENLSAVNLEDFPGDLVPKTAVLHQVWRYGQEGGGVTLKVAPVAPEVRVAASQVISLGDDRLVLAVDLRVAITRAGVFSLSFALPAGLEVEAVSGAALSHWTESERMVTLHLNGRTIGEQAFAITLAGVGPAAQAEWSVPRFSLREATRQTGQIVLVPERGLRLRAVGRENATQLDPAALGNARPGTLAFRLLQENWELKIGIEALEPWVTVQALLETTLREGQTLARVFARWKIENASVKTLRVRLPGLSESQRRTVRATGAAVSDFVPGEEADVWEIRLKRGVIGEADVEIEWQGESARAEGREAVAVPEFAEARQSALWVAVRGSGRLEIEAGDLPRGWQRVDWAAVPAALQDPGDRSVPALAYRVAEPEGALAVAVRRHEAAEALELRVAKADFTTLFSTEGPQMTAVELAVQVIERGPMRVRLPEGAQLYHTSVNGESAAVVREGEAWLFHVAPGSDESQPAMVRLVYAVNKERGDVALTAPRFSVPLENVTWRVIVPPGFAVEEHEGGFTLQGTEEVGGYGLEEYRSAATSERARESAKAVAVLARANALLQKGEQEKAGEAFSRAAQMRGLDEASGEDARVQLRALRTQQAMVGLNTRRQRLYLDHAGDAASRNEQLEQAATLNPLMRGRENFDPQQLDQLLMGNTAEENAAIRACAARLVDQQLEAEPAPAALDVTLPLRGRVVTFTRSLQVDGDAPLSLELGVERVDRTSGWMVLLTLAGVAAVVRLGAQASRRGV